ncbi:MAG: hypothetical protein KF688_11205 [Pirellulales bacterium]|nr:hypothetical protein [Pirellulales bacterium]
MPYEQVGTVLANVRLFHQRESELFHRLAERMTQPRAKLVLDAMSQHERRLAEALGEYLAAAPNQVLGTWVQLRSGSGDSLTLPEPQLAPDSAVEDLLQLGIELDEQLATVLQDCADCCEPERVRQILQSFVDQQKQEERLLARQTMRSFDL